MASKAEGGPLLVSKLDLGDEFILYMAHVQESDKWLNQTQVQVLFTINKIPNSLLAENLWVLNCTSGSLPHDYLSTDSWKTVENWERIWIPWEIS